MIKALVSDYDGTLVDHNHELNETCQLAIKNFIATGKIFTIATGRMYQGIVEDIAKQLDLQNPIIVRGGAEIIDPQTSHVIWGSYMEPAVAKQLIAFLFAQSNIRFAAESGDCAYTMEGDVQKEMGSKKYGNLKDMNCKQVPKVVVLPFSEETVIDNLLATLKEKFPSLHLAKISSRLGFGIDINNSEAGKENALIALAKILNLDLSEIAGIGDGHNDYPLLINCGFKIAMGNAPAELKAIANQVVATQEENGIVEAVELVSNL